MSLALLQGAPPASGRSLALRNMAWLLADKGLALVVGLGLVGLIARTYGPAGSGHFAYAAALLQTALGLGMVCAGAALLPRFCRVQHAMPGVLANVFVLRLLASLGSMLVMMLFCVLTVEEPQRRQVTLILLLAVPLIEPFYLGATYWLSRNHNRPTVVARSSGLLLRAAVVVLGVWWGAPMWLLATGWLLESMLNASLQTLQVQRALAGGNRHGDGQDQARGLLAWRRFVRPTRLRRYFGFGVRYMAALWLEHAFLRIDRLVLAEKLDAHEFGLYAAPMQLVEVWTQVAFLIGSALATAFLYRHLRGRSGLRALALTAACLGGIGLLGLLGAWLLGPLFLQTVFGAEFRGSQPYLLAGTAYAVLLFADHALELYIMARDRPAWLALKWASALSVAALVFWQGFERWGALVGPLGLSCGLVASWLVLGMLAFLHSKERPGGPTQRRPAELTTDWAGGAEPHQP